MKPYIFQERLSSLKVAFEKNQAFRASAHDINNMLTPAFAYTSMLSIVSLEKIPDLLARIEKSLQGAMGITSHSLETKESRSQSFARVHLAAQSLTTQLPSDCIFMVENQLPLDVQGDLNIDETHFGRLLFNLADNAYKAGAREIHIILGQEEGALRIHFRDNGPGFNGKGPLEASKESRRRSLKNGNGNAICLDFCIKAGGSLELLSKVRDDERDVGAEFIAKIPLKKADPR